MSLDPCRQPDCTFAVTGTCVLGNPPEECPQRLPRLPLPTLSDESERVVETSSAPTLEAPKENPRFPASTTFGLAEVASLMAGRYCRLVGVLGAPDSGKTALLSSLYLLLAHGQLTGYEYANSKTLMGFEEISKGTRRWNEGRLPDQLTAHTHMADERVPGFLHLRLRATSDSTTSDLLIPDLPGEWTESLIDQGRSDRWDFLQGSDVLWLIVDGRNLVDGKHMLAIHRVERLLDRLMSLLPARVPPVLLVISRRDIVDVPTSVVDRLVAAGTARGLTVTPHLVASYSTAGSSTPAGVGIDELMNSTVRARNAFGTTAKDPSPTLPHREMLRFHCHPEACP
jgi:hypothetical protein